MPNYYAHQNSQNGAQPQADGAASTVKRVHDLMTVVDGAGGVTHASEGVQAISQSMMRPYKKPIDPAEIREALLEKSGGRCLIDRCKAFPMKELPYCVAHARQEGLVETWKKGDAE